MPFANQWQFFFVVAGVLDGNGAIKFKPNNCSDKPTELDLQCNARGICLPGILNPKINKCQCV